MIQFNLLPDVKLEYVKAQRTKHAVVSGAVIATGVAVVIFLLLFVAVHVVQKKIMSDQTADIKRYHQELKETADLDKILTIQNQLLSLTDLHAAKPAAVRTFGMLQQMTPANVSLASISTDFEEETISISGSAPSLDVVNVMVDTLKYTTYEDADVNGEKAFSEVVMAQFNRGSDGAKFTITAKYDTNIFDSARRVQFKVPPQVTTRSVIDQPTLFNTKETEGIN